METRRVLFLSDLDGTWLSKEPKNRQALDQGVQDLKDEFRSRGVELEFGYVTARPPVRVVPENLPDPDWTITCNGAHIHHGPAATSHADGGYRVEQEMRSWKQAHHVTRFEAARVQAELGALLAQPEYANLEVLKLGDVVKNPAADGCSLTTAICIDEGSVRLTPAERLDANGNGRPDLFEKESFRAPEQMRQLAEDLSARLDGLDMGYQLSPIYPFSGKPLLMLDVASPLADKGQAVEYLRQQRGVEPEHVIIAGDGGNDIAMMRAPDGRDDGRRAIVVGGENELYEAASELAHAELRPPEEDCSLGVLQGLRHHLEQIAAE